MREGGGEWRGERRGMYVSYNRALAVTHWNQLCVCVCIITRKYTSFLLLVVEVVIVGSWLHK